MTTILRPIEKRSNEKMYKTAQKFNKRDFAKLEE